MTAPRTHYQLNFGDVGRGACGRAMPHALTTIIDNTNCRACLDRVAALAKQELDALHRPNCPTCQGTGYLSSGQLHDVVLGCSSCSGTGKAMMWDKATGRAL